MIGKTLGHYQLFEKLGAGGMGEVYRARDRRLDRDVAVKVLPSHLADDPAALARFEREAKAIAALSHPNILTIFDVGSEGGIAYAVTELLEGETLRERLAGGAMPVRKAVDHAAQIARGLAAAHEKAITHRDLKPENLFVTTDGRAKILDFGLARHEQPIDISSAETAPLVSTTDQGTVLGTVAYMAPEQVKGLAADHRADIFAFGTVLHEMLTGRRVFHRATAAETMAAILKEDAPDLEAVDPKIPPALARLVQHCLEKSPGERYQSARDLVFDLETISGLTVSGSGVTRAQLLQRRVRRRQWALGVAAIVVAVVLPVLGFLAGRYGAKPDLPVYRQVTFRRGTVSAARFARDAGTIVYSARWDGDRYDVFQGRLDGPDARAIGLPDAILQGVAAGEMAVIQRNPAGNVLGRVPLAQGALRPIAENVTVADWSRDGTEFAVVRVSGAAPQLEFPLGKAIYRAAGRISHPRISPRGDEVAFIDHPLLRDDRGAIVLIDSTGKTSVLSDGWASAEGLAWSPDGKEIWFTAARTGSRNELFAVDRAGRLRLVTGAPGRLALHDIAPDGRVLLAYNLVRMDIGVLAPGASEERSLSWHDYSFAVDISSDGRRVLFSESGEAGGRGYGVYLRGTDGSPAVRLGDGRAFGISPDGRWVLTAPLDDPPRIVLLPAGAGQPKTLTLPRLFQCQWAGWFPDGQRLTVFGSEPGRALRLYSLDLGGGDPRPIAAEGVVMNPTTLSPDGSVLLGFRIGQGPQRFRLYPVDGGDGVDVPGAEIGDAPLGWTKDGKGIFVAQDAGRLPLRVFLLDANTGARTPWREIRPLDPVGVVNVEGLRVTPDGKSFVYNIRRVISNLYLVEGLK